MKPRIRSILSFIFLSVISFNGLHAQTKPFSQMLIGEWSVKGPDKPVMNDTIVLTKQVQNKPDYAHWIFEEQGKFRLNQYREFDENGNPKILLSPASPAVWTFDESSGILKINRGSSDQFFKPVSNDAKSIILVCIQAPVQAK